MANKRIDKKKMAEKATEVVAKTEAEVKAAAEKAKAATDNFEAYMQSPEVKKEAKEAVSAAKEAVKTAAEKAEAKVTAKATRTKVVETILELGDLPVSISLVEKAVKKDAAARGLKGEIMIYLNTAEKVAYYTVDGEGCPEQKVSFYNI